MDNNNELPEFITGYSEEKEFANLKNLLDEYINTLEPQKKIKLTALLENKQIYYDALRAIDEVSTFAAYAAMNDKIDATLEQLAYKIIIPIKTEQPYIVDIRKYFLEESVITISPTLETKKAERFKQKINDFWNAYQKQIG